MLHSGRPRMNSWILRQNKKQIYQNNYATSPPSEIQIIIFNFLIFNFEMFSWIGH
jgi:hypothetical protein